MSLLPIIEKPAHETDSITFDDAADWHRFEGKSGHHLYVADGSRVYRLTKEDVRAFDAATSQQTAFDALGIPAVDAIDDTPPRDIPLHALSLAVAQKCNLGCTYCYAEGGSFGDTAKNMTAGVAVSAVDRLIDDAPSGGRVNLSFLGGEPLVNREVLQHTTRYASEKARLKGLEIGFSVTTNGTLVTPEDGEFFEEFGFAVTVSLDGVGDKHDLLRPYPGGGGTYDRILHRIEPLLKQQRSMQVSARVTVTPANLDLLETLNEFIRMGFHSVGFSPLLSAPKQAGEMKTPDLELMLAEMIRCGNTFKNNVVAGRRYPFTNIVNAMREIHKGTHRPYPCGAGAGYFGVSADGDLFACHRFVGDSEAQLGNVSLGVDSQQQANWLSNRHVHFQQPCSSCWARYLCGGGCHHEVINRGRTACDFIRGWLEYCLSVYADLKVARPDYFEHV